MYRIPDRIRFFSAVAATAAVPAPLRISVRFKLLRRLHRIKARNADIAIIGHPKSGTTWFRVMLSHMYHLRYGVSPRRIVKSDEYYNRDQELPRFLVSNGHYAYENVVKEMFQDAETGLMGDKKLILLARNPCDIAVSWYFQFTKRTKAFKRELINSTLRIPVDPENISMWDFVMHGELGLPALIEFYNLWQRYITGDNAGMIVRYEDLRTKPVGTMSRVVEHLGASFTQDEIARAVEFACFENMRKLEQTAYFRNSSMALRNRKDPDTLKVRRAKVGGYRDYFEVDQVAIMEDMVRSRLSPTLGYGPVPARPPVQPDRSRVSGRLPQRNYGYHAPATTGNSRWYREESA